MKIIIKLPIGEKGRFKLQSRGKMQPRQYESAVNLMGGLDRALTPKELKKKIAIVVKEYTDHFENINETLDSIDREYLLYCTSCFLENYLSQEILDRYEKRWSKYCKDLGEY